MRSFLVGVLPLLGMLAAAVNVGAVKYITSVDEFYQYVNQKENYTVVKYYTTWCSHCKTLKPVYEELGETFNNPEANVTFLEVDCEIFGSSLCSTLPGFPVVQLVKPLPGKENELSPDFGDSDDIDLPAQEDKPSKYIWSRFYDWIFGFENVDITSGNGSNRVVEYSGRRKLKDYTNFINSIIAKDKKYYALENIMDDTYKCDENDTICKDGKIYRADVLNEIIHSNDWSKLTSERSKQENIIRNNPDAELQPIRFKLDLLNYVEDKLIPSEPNDEL